MEPTPGALSGIRVINCGQILAAPFCGTVFAEFGAEVIKVEPPGTGEANRGSISFAQDNRGQKSITLDLHKADGQRLFKELCKVSDVIIENFRAGTLERMGLVPDDLRRDVNPGLVAVRISGYGQDGPYRDKGGFDRVALAFAGATAVTGEEGSIPVRPGYFFADYGAGIFAAFGALAALRARDITGQGQDVDVALYEAVWRMSGTHAANYGLSGQDRPRTGNYYPGVVPAEQFETADGRYLVINATTQRAFERLCEAMDCPELVRDERFTPRKNLLANHAVIHGIVAGWVRERTMAECQQALDACGVPATPVNAVSDIVADPHFAAREQVVSVQSNEHGPLLQPGIVPKLTGTPGVIGHPAPHLGEHNDEIYGGVLALEAEELARLRGEGVI
jgi:crotonobetainyl-CoA:carnitine CoA-transferase CaiB-like acyl-CoA transferase